MFLDYFWNRPLLMRILTSEVVKFVWCAALLPPAYLRDSGESDSKCLSGYGHAILHVLYKLVKDRMNLPACVREWEAERMSVTALQ